MKKYFIITVDTEADNQWDINHPITTENAKFLPRFQELCEKYSFKPVWLTNYEMALDDFFVSYMKCKQESDLCEIGMHLHAWFTPPEYDLAKVSDGREYLIEYPDEIMDAKIKTMTELLTAKFGRQPVSHRAGRWAMDRRYFELLDRYGYLIDCSVTPGIDWSNHLGKTGVGGADYSDSVYSPYMITNQLMEVPFTIRKIHSYDVSMVYNLHSSLSECKKLILGRTQWLRQDNILSVQSNIRLVDEVNAQNEDYLMFMIHSSELMPGGSPSFSTADDVEKLYEMLDVLFDYIAQLGYEGINLKDYYAYKKEVIV